MAAELLSCLDIVLFEYRDGSLRVIEELPGWVRSVWVQAADSTWDFGGPFSFLEHFLEEAREFWDNPQPTQRCIISEPWSETTHDGVEIGMKAIALRTAQHRIVGVEVLSSSFDFTQRAMQSAHERGIANYRLQSKAALLAARNEEAERLNNLKRDFLAQMSHELLTPLHAITGFSTLLKQGKAGELNPRQSAYVANVMTAATHLSNLIAEVMDISRIEAGHFPLQVEECDLQQLTSDLEVLLESKAASREVRLAVEILGKPRTARVDRLRLTQVLGNLLGNAIKFTPRGGLVTLTAERAPGLLRCVVQDTGEGIPELELPYIFDRFQQFPRGDASTASRGAGLGLAIAKGLVDLHEGSIAVTSKPGEGSVFTVTIPQKDASEPTAESAGGK
ncbi:MAG: HAMP domain-containing histidine kinase [Acidobacteria bacterium]|nr:HAMP domain-containing histidine kinase [Acidobacteriota bacterium]